MAWRRTGDKPLFESMAVKFTDAFMRPSAVMCQNVRRNTANSRSAFSSSSSSFISKQNKMHIKIGGEPI